MNVGFVASSKETLPQYTGTFSNLRAHSNSDDILGIEIRIVKGPKNLQGTIQFGEGKVSNLLSLEIQIEKPGMLLLRIPKNTPIYGGSTYRAEITEKAATLYSIRIVKGSEIVNSKTVLYRKKSYWD
jgi:hypothetical protein